ncbi:MAG: flap endonuclease-1 [Candidatus Micrarchaeota archaeon]
MGVDLGDLCIPKPISFDDMAGKVIAVDGNNTLYQFLSSIRQADGTPLMDSKGRVSGHLTGLFYRSVKWLEFGMKPLFVFDGKPPALKARTLQGRRERKTQAGEKMAQALSEGRTEDARMYAQATSKLTGEMIAQAETLLDALGIPHIHAPSEGEAEAADLVNRGVAWASASQDYDSVLFGAPRLVRNLSTSGRRKLPRKDEYVQVEPELITLDDVLRSSSLNRYQLAWIGILVGTDFNEGVDGIGPKKAHKLVSDAHSFKEVIARLPPAMRERIGKTDEGPVCDIENWEEIEEFFMKPPVSGTASVIFGKPDKEKTVSFLCKEFDFSSERVGRTLDALDKKQKESGGQTRLGEW